MECCHGCFLTSEPVKYDGSLLGALQWLPFLFRINTRLLPWLEMFWCCPPFAPRFPRISPTSPPWCRALRSDRPLRGLRPPGWRPVPALPLHLRGARSLLIFEAPAHMVPLPWNTSLSPWPAGAVSPLSLLYFLHNTYDHTYVHVFYTFHFMSSSLKTKLLEDGTVFCCFCSPLVQYLRILGPQTSVD